MVSPNDVQVDMPIEGGFVGMVDREHFDDWLRDRAAHFGAERRTGSFERVEHDEDGVAVVAYADRDGARQRVRARVVVGADGARSAVAKQCVKGADRVPYVFAYHEILRAPQQASDVLGRLFEPGALRHLLSGQAVARFLRLGVPARRHGQRRDRARPGRASRYAAR